VVVVHIPSTKPDRPDQFVQISLRQPPGKTDAQAVSMWGPVAQRKGRLRKRRGRPPDTDSANDKRIYEQWKASGFRSIAEFATRAKDKPQNVRLAIDRHRKRLKIRRNKSASDG
jgi:hypothetical protein